MATVPLPKISNLLGLKNRLYEEYRVEVPLIEWQDKHFIRISVQGYNTPEDVDILLRALKELLPIYRT